ncbi:hypothetical protein Golax_017055 [Gossypium laxum]|uniref:RING-type domain-containing protein n=1 Tax=Gossypium laxum TaxID=34288 RepID=A0A7J8YZR5_9ROSI|nr:hypothetical protein [Gossypium laxum]
MNTIESRGPSLRGYQWRKVVLDLNAPPCEIIEQEGTSEQVGLEEVACQPVHPASPATIDVEVIDDDVTESSATAFAEAKNNSRRSSGRTVVDLDSGTSCLPLSGASKAGFTDSRWLKQSTSLGNGGSLFTSFIFQTLDYSMSEVGVSHISLLPGWLTRSTNNNQNKHRRPPPSQTVINCDHYINLESTPQFTVKEILKPQPPPTFNCPICMGPLTEEMSTRCGHIFCKACIKAAIAVQRKCPTCRKKVTVKELFRVFLPSAS